MKEFDYINGNRVAELGHYIIHPPEEKMFTSEILRKKAIIYTKTDYIHYLFNNLKFAGNDYILVTHGSDYPIDKARWDAKPDCIKKWFSCNAEYDHPDLIPVPLGLEDTETTNGCIRGETSHHIPWLGENSERFQKKKKRMDSVFCSFAIEYNFGTHVWTNPYRANIYPSFDANGLNYYKPEERLEHKEYLEFISDFQFVLSPPGNGLDCHKTWELLYMGCTPIVLRNRIYEQWDLPIIQLTNWSELTNEYLEKYIEENLGKYVSTEQAYFSYWKNRIEEEFHKL